MAGERVLVVDDDSANLKLARIVLEDAGFEVCIATDGASALAALASFRPRVVLMDVSLPDVDGLELTRRLRRDPAYADLAIIAVTGFAGPGDDREAFDAGCDAYITKPIDIAALVAAVTAHVSGRAAARPAPP